MIIAALVLAATTAAIEPRITTYPVPGKQIPTEIMRHGDEVWFISWTTKPKLQAYFGRVDKGGKVRTTKAAEDHMPGRATHAPDGTMFISDAQKSLLWRVSPDGKIDTVPVQSGCIGIAYSPDGSLWCTQQNALLMRWGTDGSSKGSSAIPAIKQKAALGTAPLPAGTSIAAGPDDAMWFIDATGDQIGRVGKDGRMRMSRAPRLLDAFSNLAVARGVLWFSTGEPVLGQIAPDGVWSTLKVTMKVRIVATDSQQRVWFTDGADGVGYLDADNSLYEIKVPGAKSIRAMAEGPDGAMWFADQGALAIGRIELPAAAPRP